MSGTGRGRETWAVLWKQPKKLERSANGRPAKRGRHSAGSAGMLAVLPSARPAPPLARAPVATSQLSVRCARCACCAGISGAGRSAKQNLLYAEATEGINAYGVTRHRHMPEIEQVSRQGGRV